MTIGWYVHHQGAGHRNRLLATLAHLEGVTALTSLPEPAGAGCDWLMLPLDLCDSPADPTANGTLHWAPLRLPGLRARMAQIAAWIAAARPDVLVVDVSVEVALLGRLLGVPTVVVAQRGRRTDAAHALAYAQAAAVVAPWSAAAHLPGDGLPDDRLRFTGAVGRFDGAPAAPATGDDVLLLLGRGGHAVSADDVHAAAATTPGRTWHVAGGLGASADNVVDHGADADVGALLPHCSIVVGTAGGNVVAEVAAARRPYVCLPQARPFAEQERQAEALRRLGVAEVRSSWPAAADWPGVLAAAAARDTARWAALHDGHGAKRLADVVLEIAAGRPAAAPAPRPGSGAAPTRRPPEDAGGGGRAPATRLSPPAVRRAPR